MKTIQLRRIGIFSLIISLSVAEIFDSHGEEKESGQKDIFSAEGLESALKNISGPPLNYRLNVTLIPISYKLSMRPVLDDENPGLQQFTAPSTVLIRVQSVSNTSENTIIMHQRDLKIDEDKVTVTNLNSTRNMTISSQSYEKARDLYILELEKSFQNGEILEIFIPYTINISRTENVGLYLGHYTDPLSNETRYLAAMKLEPYHARKVWPCFDEPSLKATYTISVGRLEGRYHSLSNMEINFTERDLEFPGYVWDHYHKSVLMSSYLVCVIVSDFASSSVVLDAKNRTVVTWAPKHDIDKDGGVWGAVTGAKILNFFEQRYKMDYALPKMDAIALPQFASGAMENFGLITYKYNFLVWVPGEGTEAERRKVTQVLAHEIVHQWYGNIVTCGWWSDIWLNEGFARLMQFWGMQETIPEFLIEEAFVNDAVQLAMAFDQGPGSHPVKNNAQSPTESQAVFDRISYEKGASLLKMMDWFLTKPVFEMGIIDIYLDRMKWTSAYQDDLFQAIQDAVESNNATNLLPGVSIKTIMDGWTLQIGYPIVKVATIDSVTISLSQERFIWNGTSGNNRDDTKWWIPVKVVSTDEGFNSSQKLPDIWISNEQSSVQYTRDGLNTSELIMANPDAHGYYRVLYDETLTNRILNQLKNDHTLISSSSRSQLLDDYFALAFADYADISVPLKMTEYLIKESSSNVWTGLLTTNVKYIMARFSQNDTALSSMKKYFVPILDSALNRIGIRQPPNQKGINVTLRALLLDTACQMRLPACIEYATELLNKWLENPNTNPFPVDLQSSLYCSAVSSNSNNESVWPFLFNKFTEARNGSSQQTLLLTALACSNNISQLSEFLESVVDKGIQAQVLLKEAMNPLGRELVYEFIKRNLVSGDIAPQIFANVVSTLCDYWKEESDIENLQQFIDLNEMKLQPVRESLNSSLKKIRAIIKWWTAFGNRMQEWFENHLLIVS